MSLHVAYYHQCCPSEPVTVIALEWSRPGAGGGSGRTKAIGPSERLLLIGGAGITWAHRRGSPTKDMTGIYTSTTTSNSLSSGLPLCRPKCRRGRGTNAVSAVVLNTGVLECGASDALSVPYRRSGCRPSPRYGGPGHICSFEPGPIENGSVALHRPVRPKLTVDSYEYV